MHPSSRFALLAPAALFAAMALPASAPAQYRLPTITTFAKADSIHASAQLMAETTHRWRDAARLHRQSASLRSADDTMGTRCLTLASYLSFASNDLSSAQRDMVAAAEHALARGDVAQAANAYADAAWLAKERRNPGQVWTLGRQAEVLASSPLLSGAQRAHILQRFTHPERALATESTR